MNYLIKISVVLALAAVASGNLPTILLHVKKAQLQLIQDSKASKWPKAMTLPSRQFVTCNWQYCSSGQPLIGACECRVYKKAIMNLFLVFQSLE